MAITTKDVNAKLDTLCDQLRHRQLKGPYAIALATALLLRQLVSQGRWSTTTDLTEQITQVAQRLRRAQPQELITTNVARRVLHIVREVRATVEQDMTTVSSTPSTTSLSSSSSSSGTSTPVPSPVPINTTPRQPSTSALAALFNEHPPGSPSSQGRERSVEEEKALSYEMKPELIQSLQELIDELESGPGNIATQAAEHIHENEIILTMGRSLTVEAFLKAAAKKRRFQVVVAETGPDFQGHAQALALTKHGIQTTVISDAAVFAVMSRMNKVLLEAHTVLANGGVMAIAGSRLMAEAATVHKTPVMLAASAIQLSPEALFDPSTHTECISPSHLLPSLEAREGGMVDEVNPVREYIPPSSIDLYLTNVGAHPTSYLTRLISENYHVQDTYLGW